MKTILIPTRDGWFRLAPEELAKRLFYARQRASKSKTGDPACSVAASHWARKTATAEDYKTLAACRAKARGLKQAESLKNAGKEAKAQHVEHRIKAGEPLTAKDRLAKAKELVKGRADTFKAKTAEEERARRMAEVEERIRRGHEEAERREAEEFAKREAEEKKAAAEKPKKEETTKKKRETAKEKQKRLDEEKNAKMVRKFIDERDAAVSEAERAVAEKPNDLTAKLRLAIAKRARLEIDEFQLSNKIAAGVVKAGPNDLDDEAKGYVEERRKVKRQIEDLFGDALAGFGTPVPGTHAFHGMANPEPFHRVEYGGVSYNYNPNSPSAKNAIGKFLAMLAIDTPIPRSISRHTGQVYLTDQRSKHDAFWQNHASYQKALAPGEQFVSNGSGGDGNVVVYNSYISKKTLLHEMGHNVAFGTWGSTTPSGEYAEAIASGEPPVSEYAKVNSDEDFAETIKHYAEDPAKLREERLKRFNAIQKILGDYGNA